jgi:hypothetical protein
MTKILYVPFYYSLIQQLIGDKGTKSLGDKRDLSQKNTFLKEKEDMRG